MKGIVSEKELQPSLPLAQKSMDWFASRRIQLQVILSNLNKLKSQEVKIN